MVGSGQNSIVGRCPKTRYDSDEIVDADDDVDDGTFWLVRSPWPEISIQDAVDLMWEWVFERQPPRSGPVTAQAQLDQQTLVRQFLHLDQQSVLEFRTGHIPPD